MQSRFIPFLLFCALPLYAVVCSDGKIPTADGNSENLHYVAIDIDDIFQPNWDIESHRVGTVKMNREDVDALIDLTDTIRLLFNRNFYFSIGYNSGFYDSTNSGDRAFIENASEFRWFNHFPNHEHVEEYGYSSEKIDELFLEGKRFEKEHGLSNYISTYMVTPLHDGLWPPYDPLYDNFEKYHITSTSTPAVNKPASYGTVKILHRTFTGLGSSQYSFDQVNRSTVAAFAEQVFSTILEQKTVIFYTHQANYAKDHLANELLAMLIDHLRTQEELTVVFLPAEEVVRIAYELQDTPSPSPEKRR